MPRCPHGSALRTMRRPAPASPRSRLSSRSQPLPNEGEETLNPRLGAFAGFWDKVSVKRAHRGKGA